MLQFLSFSAYFRKSNYRLLFSPEQREALTWGRLFLCIKILLVSRASRFLGVALGLVHIKYYRKGVMYLSKLTIKQKKFADEYIISGNASEAALKAGYRNEVSGRENLQKPTVKSYIDERMKKLDEKSIADQKEVLEYLTRVMRGEEKEEVLANIGNFEQEIKEMTVGAKDRIKAAELIGKRYSLWTDKVDLDSNITIVFEDDYGD